MPCQVLLCFYYGPRTVWLSQLQMNVTCFASALKDQPQLFVSLQLTGAIAVCDPRETMIRHGFVSCDLLNSKCFHLSCIPTCRKCTLHIKLSHLSRNIPKSRLWNGASQTSIAKNKRFLKIRVFFLLLRHCEISSYLSKY